jgi:hypothetical protein
LEKLKMDEENTVVSESRVPELLQELISEGLNLVASQDLGTAMESLEHCENVIESVIT